MALTLQTFDRMRDAVAALEKDKGLHYLGGGTILVRRVNSGELTINGFVRSKVRGSDEIRVSGGRVHLGAAVTMAQIGTHPELGWLAPAARAVGGPAIRNMATVGGNLFARAPFGDFTVALLALEATVTVQAGYTARELPIHEFLAARDRQFGRAIVSSIAFRVPAPSTFRYLKVSRVRPRGAPVLTLAAVLPESTGRISQVRIAYGGMAPTAMRAASVERALGGRPRSAEGIAPALEVATQDTTPADDSIASAWYRYAVLPVYLKRLLLS